MNRKTSPKSQQRTSQYDTHKIQRIKQCATVPFSGKTRLQDSIPHSTENPNTQVDVSTRRPTTIHVSAILGILTHKPSLVTEEETTKLRDALKQNGFTRTQIAKAAKNMPNILTWRKTTRRKNSPIYKEIRTKLARYTHYQHQIKYTKLSQEHQIIETNCPQRKPHSERNILCRLQ